MRSARAYVELFRPSLMLVVACFSAHPATAQTLSSLRQAVVASLSIPRVPPDAVPVLSKDRMLLAYSTRSFLQSGPVGATLTNRRGTSEFSAGVRTFIFDTRRNSTIQLCGQESNCWAPVWSPSGDRLAFFSDRGGFPQLWIWYRDSRKIRKLTDREVSSPGNFVTAKWLTDGTGLIVKLLTESTQAQVLLPNGEAPHSSVVQVWNSSGLAKPVRSDVYSKRFLGELALVSVSGGGLRILKANSTAVGYWLSPGGHWLALTQSAPSLQNSDAPIYNLSILDMRSGIETTVANNLHQEWGQGAAWSQDGLLAYKSRPLPGQSAILHVYDPKSRRTYVFAGALDGGLIYGPTWSGDALYVAQTDPKLSSRTLQLVRWNPRTNETRTIEVSGFHTGLFQLDQTAFGSEGVILTAVGDDRLLHLLTWNGSEVAPSDSVLGPISHGAFSEWPSTLALSKDQKELYFPYEGRETGYAIGSIAIASPKRIEVRNDVTAYRDESWGDRSVISWTSFGGVEHRAVLIVPQSAASKRKAPLVLCLYPGLDFVSSLNEFDICIRGLVPLLTEQGFAILLPTAKVNGPSVLADMGRTFMPAIDAVRDARVDTDRVGVIGHSYGGYSTLALISDSTRFHAAVDIAGPSNLYGWYGDFDPSGDAQNTMYQLESGQFDLGGVPWKKADTYVANSPVEYVDRIRTPLLIIHGDEDTLVPVQQSEEMFSRLRRVNGTVEFVRYRGEGHQPDSFSRTHQIDAWMRVSEWFARYLR